MDSSPAAHQHDPSMDSTSDDQAAAAANEGGSDTRMFRLKKWNAVAMWSWDVECDTCAICRVQVRTTKADFGTNVGLNFIPLSLIR